MTTETTAHAEALAAAQKAATEAQARATEAALLARVYRSGVTDETLAAVIARGLVGADETAVAAALAQVRPAPAAPAPIVTLPSPGPVADDLPTDPAKWRERGALVAARLATKG